MRHTESKIRMTVHEEFGKVTVVANFKTSLIKFLHNCMEVVV
jgi:hypothetical protein